MMNIQELQTLVGYKLPVKIIILNNDGYHSIRQTQEAYFSDSLIGIGPDCGVTMPNFIAVGNSFGMQSKRITKPIETKDGLAWLLENNSEPVLLEVMLDTIQTFSPKLASRKLADGTMVSPELEDMAPFLSREEFRMNMFE
jgi:acetolactate synthase-1/2/3 large subunit